MRAFFDTNVLASRFYGSSPDKQHTSSGLLQREADGGRVLLSTQACRSFLSLRLALTVSAALQGGAPAMTRRSGRIRRHRDRRLNSQGGSGRAARHRPRCSRLARVAARA